MSLPGRARPRCPALLAGALLAIGCSEGIPTPPAPPPAVAAPRPEVVAPPRPAPAPAPPPPARVEARLSEPLPPLTRPIVAVSLPGVDYPLTSVQGRSGRDLWILGTDEDGGSLVHYEPPRIRIVTRWREEAFLPNPPRHTPDAFESVFAYGRHVPFFGSVALDRDRVYLMGSVFAWARGPGQLRGSLSKDGKWSHGPYYYQGRTCSSGEHLWTLDCGSDFGNCVFGMIGGPEIPLPSREAVPTWEGDRPPRSIGGIWMLGPDDGWMTTADDGEPAVLFRYNGVSWAEMAELDADLTVEDLWADEAGHAWIAARRGGDDHDPANRILRFDGHALQPLPVPPSFAATVVRGHGTREVWFVGGGRKVYQWDGEKLHQGEAPFTAGEAWVAPDGEVWLVSDGKGPKGLAARIAPVSEVR